MKFYIHHLYNKSLFYTLFHNTTDREYYIENDEGKIYCKYNNTNLELVFKKEISYEEDGYHILDYFTALFYGDTDEKIGFIHRDRDFMEREDLQILNIFHNLIKECPENQKWIITYLRTEKILHSFDTNILGKNTKLNEIEDTLNKFKNHHIINDNIFLDDLVQHLYPNFKFCFTNSIFQWNKNWNIRWYYEFKQIYDKLSFEYDLMYSVRNHKGFRVELLNELHRLDNDKILLQSFDAINKNKYYEKYGKFLNNNIKTNSIYGNCDFDDISYIANHQGYMDLFFRVLPKAKMQILCETWSQYDIDYKSQYLSEKTLGFILSGIPFISTHSYPLKMIQIMLEVPPHPFFEESEKFQSNAREFSNFVNEFMQDFDKNYKLCKEWSDLAFEKIMYKIQNENSLLDLIRKNSLNIENINKKLL